MHTIDYIIIFIYLGMIILAGFIGLKKAKSKEDYLVSGRSLPVIKMLGKMPKHMSHIIYIV